MTLRRYAPMKPSAGTRWPDDVREAIEARDRVCVGMTLALPPYACSGGLELDHVRASGGVGMKSRSTLDNGVRLCGGHHRYKTDHGREIRPLLIDYIDAAGHTHVDPVPGCHQCYEVFG